MNAPETFAMGDINKEYCKFCCRADGSMQSYEEKLESMVEFIKKVQNVGHEAAVKQGKESMAKLPAWADQ